MCLCVPRGYNVVELCSTSMEIASTSIPRDIGGHKVLAEVTYMVTNTLSSRSSFDNPRHSPMMDILNIKMTLVMSQECPMSFRRTTVLLVHKIMRWQKTYQAYKYTVQVVVAHTIFSFIDGQ